MVILVRISKLKVYPAWDIIITKISWKGNIIIMPSFDCQSFLMRCGIKSDCYVNFARNIRSKSIDKMYYLFLYYYRTTISRILFDEWVIINIVKLS